MLARVVTGLILLSVLVLVLSSLPGSRTSTVEAEPKQPHVVYGVARTQSGDTVPSGLSVEARIGNVHYGQSVNAATGVGTQTTRTHAATASGSNFGSTSNFQVCADDPGTPLAIEGASLGSSIYFYVDGIQATVLVGSSESASLAFAFGGVTSASLIIPSLTATKAIAATASDDACTTRAAATTAPPPPPPPAPPPPPPVVEEVVIILVVTATPTPTPEPTPVTIPTAEPLVTPTPTPIPPATIEVATKQELAEIIAQSTINQLSEVFELVSAAAAAAIIDGSDTTKAALILQEVSTAAAASAVELVETTKAATVLERLDDQTASDILALVTKKKAGSIMEQVTTGKLTAIVETMDEVKLNDRLPHMSPQKLFAIPLQVRLRRLQRAPTEQLVSEIPPQADPDLPPPTRIVLGPTRTRYTVPQTKPGAFARMVESPAAPLDGILGKFNKQLNDVKVEIQDLDVKPAQAPDLSSELTVNSLFSVDISNAKPDDISLAHVSFFVKQSWVEANNIHKWSIAFNRFDEEENMWVPVQSKRVAEDDERIHYTLVMPKFSAIALTGSTNLPEQIFNVTDLNITPSAPRAGQDVTISAWVTNTSASRALYAANLWVNDTIKTTQFLPVEPGQPRAFDFTIALPEGVHNIRVERLLGRFVVGAPAPTLIPQPEAPTTAPTPLPPVKPVVTSMATPPPAIPMPAVEAPTATPTKTSVTPTPTPSTGIGTGTIIGIVAGVIVIVGGSGAGLVIFSRRQKRPPTSPPSVPPGP